MKAELSYKYENFHPVSLSICGSKSESNRLLILQALFPNIRIKNLSTSDDTKLLAKGLNTETDIVDVHHAGTAMRFLTAYYASIEGKTVTLTGSKRMQQRPISVLVDALRSMGADIKYLGEVGFPPLKIKGSKLDSDHVSLDATVSSQYISALMLTAPSLDQGLRIKLKGDPISSPYIDMTLTLLKGIGINCHFSDNIIRVENTPEVIDQVITVESDWSSASYFYSLVSISRNLSIVLKDFQKESLQGDSALVKIYKKLGVDTTFDPNDNSMTLTKSKSKPLPSLDLNLANTPDIAQTIAVSCLALKIKCKLTGLQTLKIKETDRLMALKIELEKLGASVQITDDSLSLFPSEEIADGVSIGTYNDHRMAMAFAPLAAKTCLIIEDCEVVSKSFPSFWKDLQKLGFKIDFE